MIVQCLGQRTGPRSVSINCRGRPGHQGKEISFRFRSGPQGTEFRSGPQGIRYSQRSVQFSLVQFSSDQSKSELKPSSSVQDQTNVPVSSSSQSSQCKLAVCRSSIEIDNSLRDKINSLLREEILHKDILEEIESTGRNELLRGQEKYKLQKKLLMIHVTGQPEDVQYWRVVVPDDLDVKSLLVSELHSVPYSAHPGVQRTIGKVRRYF